MSKKYYELTTKEEVVKEMNKLMDGIDDLWVLWLIYRCALMSSK